MSTTTRSLLPAILACLSTLLPLATLAQPASEPLLTRAAAVRPNLMFILDNSGSMGDTDAYARHYYVATGSCGTSNLAIANYAPINNQLTYDPAKRYLPAYTNAGLPGSNASTTSFSDYTFYLPKTGENIPGLTTKSAICTASRYNTYKVTSTAFWLDGVNKGTTNPVATKGAKRSDCAGTTCTLAEEKRNIANWRTYHQTRLKAARTGLGAAFAEQPDTFRMGWGTIHMTNPNKAVSGDADDPTSMKDYFLAKTDFYTWLNTFATESGTPLRKALDVAGQYYSRSDNNGPWAHSPWKSNSEGEDPKDHLSCRRSYTILITDGEWNNAGANATLSATDQDGVNGPEIVHNDGVTKYTYVPRSSDARSVGRADKITSGTAYSDTLADVAHYYWARDLRGTGNVPLVNDITAGKVTDKPFWQNMITFTAGLGVQGTLSNTQYSQARAGTLNWPQANTSVETRIDDLVHAAHNGGGEYLFVTDADSFTTEIGRVVGSIASEQFSQSGVAASAVTLTAGTKKFVPYFTSGLWWGNVKMINLNSNGDESSVAWEVVETDTLGKPTGTTKIPSNATRNVYTWVNGTTKAINFKTLSILGANGVVAANAASNKETLLVDTITQDQIDFLRGVRTNEGANGLGIFRARESIMGDVINATPVLVKDVINLGYENLPTGTPGLSSYSAYKVSKGTTTNGGTRDEGVLFIGANDGMLHAFREGTGTGTGGNEVFAYVPRGVLGKIHQLTTKTYTHQYFVDGPLVETDAYIMAPNLLTAGSSLRWTNLVLGNLGAGGKGVFAIDTTSPLSMSAKSVLWEINADLTDFADLGYAMGEVQAGITASGDWVAIFGNGKYGTSGKGHLFIVNLSTGALIKKIDTNSQTANGLMGVRVVRNSRGQIIGAYGGDLRGNVWRFDLSASVNTSWPNAGQRLFTATGPTSLEQPITVMPAVIPRTDNTGYMVIFGTGKLFDMGDQTNVDVQSAYGIWDSATFGGSGTFSAVPDYTKLVPVTLAQETDSTKLNPLAGSSTNTGVTSFYKTSATRTIDWASDRGWYINYTITPGQRSIYAVEPLQLVVRIDTVAPRLTAISCTVGASKGYNLLVEPLTGMCKTRTTLDTNNDGTFDASDSQACIYSTEADGEDVVLDIRNAAGASTGFVDIQDSRGHVTAQVGNPPVVPPITPSGSLTRDWRQIFPRR